MIETRAILALLPVVLAFVLTWEYAHYDHATDHTHGRECVLSADSKTCEFRPEDWTDEKDGEV